jgi:oligoribonuclease NrnB/cAMP/cGMP phosphodiesterase (DHH superfamily)
LGDIIQEGKAIIRYVSKENRKYVEASAFPLFFSGLRCIAVNKLFANSQLFNAVWNEYRYDAMLTFGYRGNKWVVSLYTTRDDVDVSEVAMAYGGGGHKKAAGFTCEQLPWGLCSLLMDRQKKYTNLHG